MTTTATPQHRLHGSHVGLRIALVFISLALAWLHPFYGTTAALVGVVLLHFYYPGYLLARVLGIGQAGHPLARFAWWLAAAFGLTIPLGGLARLLAVPTPVYLLGLHAVMLVLALLPARLVGGEDHPAVTRPRLPYLLLVAVCCLVVLYVGIERNRFRFDGYEDQTVFVELVDWLSHNPDDRTIDSRRIGLPLGQAPGRWDYDGWSYNHAAWVWVSGIPASQFVWFDLTPLFIWATPLAWFGLAYTLSRRESAAAWSVVALTIIGLMTLDSLVTYNSTLVYGQFSLFQLNSLRTFATSLLSPLVLMAALAYVRRPCGTLLALTLLLGLATAMTHPRPVITLGYTVGATAVVWWLARPSKRRFVQTAGLLLVLLLPFVILALQSGALSALLGGAPPVSQEEVESDVPAALVVDTAPDTGEPEAQDPPQPARAMRGDPRGELITLHDLPVIGDSFIVDPRSVFYHPAIILGVILGLLAAFYWRRHLAAAYFAAATVSTLVFLFVPGITPLMAKITTPTVIASLIFGVPVPLILGFALDFVLRRVGRTGQQAAWLNWAAAVGAITLMFVLLFEPFPIPASARDQIRASNAMQAPRQMRESDSQLVAALQTLLPAETRTVVLTPHRIANFVSEDVPYVFVTGGREQDNRTLSGTSRFVSQGENSASSPWFDSVDVNFLREWHVSHIVLDADATRAPQLVLDPRFRLLGQPAGYVVFEVLDTTPQPTDDLFAQMNRVYEANVNQRWGPQGFALNQPGNAELWTDLIDRWQALPETDTQRLGLAFTLTLAGDDRAAAPYWQALAEDHADTAYFVPALAAVQSVVTGPDAAKQTLLHAPDETASPSSQVLAARMLLTADYFYFLSAADLDRVLAVTEAHPTEWDHLAVYGQEDAVRQRVVLLLARQRWDVAERWQAAIPEVELSPRDFVTRALIALVQGDVEHALALLEPATDPDLVAANRLVHPDRWVENPARNLWLGLRAGLAERAGNPAAAQALYRQMAETGTADLDALYFAAASDAEREAVLAEWESATGETAPALVSPLAVADARSLFIIDPVAGALPGGGLRVEVTFGSLHEQPFPVREWRLQVISPDASVFYADISRPAVFASGALSRPAFDIDLPDDVPPDTEALVVIKALYDNRVELGVVYLPVTLNPSG